MVHNFKHGIKANPPLINPTHHDDNEIFFHVTWKPNKISNAVGKAFNVHLLMSSYRK